MNILVGIISAWNARSERPELFSFDVSASCFKTRLIVSKEGLYFVNQCCIISID